VTSSLRFCFLTTFYPPYNFGGDGIGVQRLARGLTARGHHVTVIHDTDAYRTLSGRDPAESLTTDPFGVEVVTLRSALPVVTTLMTQQAGRPVVHGARIKRLLEEGDFDVINFHNISLIGGPGLLRYGRGVKLYMAHEHWLVCPSHVLWRHDREMCTGRECVRCTLAYRRPPQYWRYSGFLTRELRHVDAFIAMSEFSRQKHREFGFPREMEVLPYFVPEGDTPRQAAGTDAAPHHRPYFLCVGRLERIKGFDDVIPLFRQYPAADLLIAGDGTHGEVLRDLAAGMPNVRFLGHLGPDELSRLYRHALALIVPSVGFETFGIILIEAFRHATPVLARRIGPFPEIVAQSGAGEIFDGRDDLVLAMHRLQADEPRRRRFAAAGADAVEKYWSEAVVVPRYLDIVSRAAGRKGVSLRQQVAS
jgi:glycosyltransferase involved in cell wall biosynthesis